MSTIYDVSVLIILDQLFVDHSSPDIDEDDWTRGKVVQVCACLTTAEIDLNIVITINNISIQVVRLTLYNIDDCWKLYLRSVQLRIILQEYFEK